MVKPSRRSAILMQRDAHRDANLFVVRTTVIAGRPDLGAPDWRGNVPGRPMSSDEVSDVVAWLAAKRPQG